MGLQVMLRVIIMILNKKVKVDCVKKIVTGIAARLVTQAVFKVISKNGNVGVEKGPDIRKDMQIAQVVKEIFKIWSNT